MRQRSSRNASQIPGPACWVQILSHSTFPLPVSELQMAHTGNGNSHLWKSSREAGLRADSTAEEEKNLGEDGEL